MPVRIIFTEEFCQPENLYPFTLTRQIQDIRVGILTIREKWEHCLQAGSLDKWEDDYKDLGRSIRISPEIPDDTYFMIHGNLLPSAGLVSKIKKLKNGEFLSVNGKEGVVFRFTRNEIEPPHKIRVSRAVTLREAPVIINYPWEILSRNNQAIRDDFELLTAGRKSQLLSKTNKVSGRKQVFVEKGARIEHAVINAEEGPVYIGRGAIVMEGSLIRGPVSIGEKAVVKMGAKIYGATTIGPGSTVGGEIKNAILFGYSNKAHDGYLGDSVLGEWCNLGAGTTNSNVKNNAGSVNVWTQKGERNAGIKCGTFVGDYSKTAINTSINTGTVIGVCCNVFGQGLTPKYIPSFSWGYEGVERYQLQKALTDIDNWKKLKGETIQEEEKTILTHIFSKF